MSQVSNGDTYDELKKTLHLNDNKTLTANQFHALYDRIFESGNDETSLTFANRIYVKDGCKLNEHFREIAVEKFASGVESMDFSRNIEAAQAINRFVEEETHGKIKNFIAPNSINAETALITINAISFSGTWEHQFDKTLTKKHNFYINEHETVRVDFMKTKQKFAAMYNYELNTSILQMNYANSNLSFIILLPKNRTGLSTLENELKNFDVKKIFRFFDSQLSEPHEIEVLIPKFGVEYEIKLNDILKNVRKLCGK